MPKQNIIWAPMPKQTRFLTCPGFECGYGGAPGGGKTDGMVIAPLMDIQHEGFHALIIRRRYTDLERSIMQRCQELYRGRAKWDGTHKRWTFPNRSTVEFGHCQYEGDIQNYQSAQFQFIGIEQVEQFTESMYRYLFARIRSPNNPNIKPKMRSNFNPGGVGHNWLKKRFWIGEREPNKLYNVKETFRMPDGKEEEIVYQRAFIPAIVFDNEHIMKNDKAYIARLMALPEPMRTAYLEGRFDLFEGQFFKEWNPAVHTCKPFEIPGNWTRWISFDWGYGDRSSMAMLWFAEDPKTKTIFCYRELYINQTIDIDVAKQMEDLSANENIQTIFYPWDLDNKNSQTGVSMHERMDEATHRKFYWKIANKDRKNGWSACRYLLKPRSNGEAILKVFDTCTNLIRTLPEQIYDETNSEDLDTYGEDHAADALRYFAATFRPLLEIQNDAQKDSQPIDVGGAYLIPALRLPTGEIRPREFRFKKEPAQSFSWMSE